MPVDWIVGTAATLIAAIWTSKLHHRALAPLPPVICNMVLVGAEIAWFFPAEGMGFWAAFGINAPDRGHRRGGGLLHFGLPAAAGPAPGPRPEALDGPLRV